MKRTLMITAAVAFLATTPLLVPQAQADPEIDLGAIIRIAGADIHIGYRDRGHDGHRYYRSRHHMNAPRDHYHGGDCYYEDEYYYHDESCPVARRHIERYGPRSVEVYVEVEGDRGYRDRDYRDREYRHRDEDHYDYDDDHYDHDYDDHRGERRGRGRGHGKHKNKHRGGYCPH